MKSFSRKEKGMFAGINPGKLFYFEFTGARNNLFSIVLRIIR